MTDSQCENAHARCENQRARETRALYIERGRCPYCYGRNPAEPGREACRECRIRRNEQARARYHARRASGLCWKCKQPVPEGTTICIPCHERQQQYHATSYRRQREEGLCTVCGMPSPQGRGYCEMCAKEQAALFRRRYAAKRALRDTCKHTRWRIAQPKIVALEATAVRLLWRMWCVRCRKTEQHTFWAQPGRLAEVFGEVL